MGKNFDGHKTPINNLGSIVEIEVLWLN
jgi:hypothetical protein